MPAGPSLEPAAGRPYFFLSYARTPRHDPDDTHDPDRWVAKLYQDLCRHIMQLTDAQPREAGFMDRQMRPGTEWPARLAGELATCRVFVPLYSPRYFESDECGKEWLTFATRALNHGAKRGARIEAIVPALWVAVEPGEMPEAAQSVQFDHDSLGARYRTEGFYGIMKLTRYRHDYQQATLGLARRIVEVARRTEIEPGDPTDYLSQDSAFGRESAPHRSARQICLTVAAPSAPELPEGRTPYYYGRTAREWNPYRPDCARPLADHAADVVRTLGYRPTVATVEDKAEPAGQPRSAAPELILVDAWSVASPDCRDRLRAVDQSSDPWVGALVPWNDQDSESAAAGTRLWPKLTSALRRTMARTPLTCRMAAEGIPTLEDFSAVLPAMARVAVDRYLNEAPAKPPPGPLIRRPRLSGPIADDPKGPT